MRRPSSLPVLIALVVPSAGVACAQIAQSPVEAPPVQRRTVEPGPTPEPEPVASDPCAEHDGLVIEPIAPIAAEWRGSSTVAGRGPVVVRWCGAGVVTLRSITVGERSTGQTIYEPDPALAQLEPGAAFTREAHGAAGPAALPVVADAVDEHGQAYTARATLTSLDDPERAAQRSACEAAGGSWRGHGMRSIESCDRPTHDAGRRCLSDADCEGPCIEDGIEPLTGSVPVGAKVPECGPGRALELRVGHCHDRSLRFGCYPRLTKAAVTCSSPGFGRRLHSVCVD